ncbi:Formate--tetrahydrofolate ligase [Crocosphaera watsonii WH 0401]|uniref:Formate--tetrahydrofolate ligase n=1 Tax=Crocosphaera watsonii WH 0401 TaxID=555881 RepID=T2JG99_CROWT|nr:Formate--tetrahydrofolate ligase [Crocosphaera watsonii WH 0401]
MDREPIYYLTVIAKKIKAIATKIRGSVCSGIPKAVRGGFPRTRFTKEFGFSF